MGLIKMLIVGAVFGLFLIGSMYFTYYIKDQPEQEPQVLEHKYLEKVPLYYNLDDPGKVYVYDDIKKEYVEVQIDE